MTKVIASSTAKPPSFHYMCSSLAQHGGHGLLGQSTVTRHVLHQIGVNLRRDLVESARNQLRRRQSEYHQRALRQYEYVSRYT
eukprot:6193848-Pleurochrysis_carterae.AAC.2